MLGKVKPKYAYVRAPLTEREVDGHLEGSGPGVGVVPLLDDGERVAFAVLDVDIPEMDPAPFLRRLREGGIPLVPIRSKSGGMHLTAFFEEPIEAEIARRIIGEWAAFLGLAGHEIFPKQVRRVEGDSPGSAINLPYYGETRRALDLETGRELDLDEFLDAAEAARGSLGLDRVRSELRHPIIDRTAREGDLFADGPPCLQTIWERHGGFSAGERNRGMFNVALYLKAKHGREGDEVQNRLHDLNVRQDKPLETDEVTKLAKSVLARDYAYTCREEPICGHCNATLCHARQYGIGALRNALPFDVSGLTEVWCGDEPAYYLNVNGRRIRLESIADLHNQRRFRDLVAPSAGISWALLKERAWIDSVVNRLLQQRDVETLEWELSEDAQVVDQVREYLRVQGTRNRATLASGIPWIDEQNGVAYVRPQPLREWIVRTLGSKTRARELYALLREYLSAETTQLWVEGQNLHLWRIGWIPERRSRDAEAGSDVDRPAF